MSDEIHIPGTVSQREAAIEAALAELFGFGFIEGAQPGKSFAMEHAKGAVDKLRALLCPAPPAPVAPVTEGEVGAAINACCSLAADEIGDGTAECQASTEGAKVYLHALIARRVAEARGVGLRELRARLVDFCRIRDRGYDVRSDFSPLWVLDEIDRLLAAPPASKLAEEPAQEAKPSLSWRSIEPFVLRLVAAARVEGGNWMWNHLRKGDEAPTEGESQRCMDAVYAAVKALREQVESQARRIEALERAAQGGDK